MDDKIITLQTFDNPTLAHIIRTRLEANNIPCFLADEHIIGLNPLYNPAIGGVKLKIFEKDYEKCMSLLAEDEDLMVEDEQTTDKTETSCPACNSTNVGYGNATKKRFGILTMAVSFLTMSYPIINRRAWHCYQCGEEFQ